MEATGHGAGAVALVVELANALTPGHARGRPQPQPEGAALRDAVVTALADRPNRARVWAAADDAEHEALRSLAHGWRAVLTAAADDGPAGVAREVNRLLADAPVAPVLVDHDGEPWHLHAHPDGARPADGLAATAALALAAVVADDALDRVGTCDAAACDRLYLDTSRNGSRRYCSGACQARAKTAAYRARRA